MAAVALRLVGHPLLRLPDLALQKDFRLVHLHWLLLLLLLLRLLLLTSQVPYTNSLGILGSKT